MRSQLKRRVQWKASVVTAVLLMLLAACGNDGQGTGEAEGTGTGTGGGDVAAPTPPDNGEAATPDGEATEATEATDGGSQVDCTDIGTVRMGLTGSSSDAPFFIAEERGYFEDAGITPEFIEFDSGAKMIAPLGGGQLDVGAGAPSAGFYNALTREIGFRIVADKGSMPPGHGYFPLLVRADLHESGQVTGPEDMAGLTVAEAAQGIAGASTLNEILKSGGLTYDDIEHQYIGFGEHLTAFENQAIDASMTTEPTATLLEDRGLAVRLGSPAEHYPNQQLAVILYGNQFIERDDDAGACTMIAYLQGARDYVDALEDGSLTGEGAEEIAQIIASASGMEAELIQRITPHWVDPDGKLNMESIEKDYEFIKSLGLLEGEVDLSEVVDPSFAETAVAELGEWEGERP